MKLRLEFYTGRSDNAYSRKHTLLQTGQTKIQWNDLKVHQCLGIEQMRLDCAVKRPRDNNIEVVRINKGDETDNRYNS